MTAHFIKKTLFNAGVLVLSLISGFVITSLSVWVPLDGPQMGTINCGFPSGLPFSFRGTWKYLSGPPHPSCALAFDLTAWMADIIFWAGVVYLILFFLKKAAKHFRIILNEGRIIAILIIFILILWVVLIRNANAQPVGRFDLKNLRDQNPLLTKAYDIIRLQETWEKIIQSNFTSFAAVIIGIVDTGVDPDHQEFNVPQVNLGSFPRSVLFDFDPGGHGTQIAGIIGANNVLGTSTLPLNSPQMNGILSGVLNENNYTLEIRQIGGQIQISVFAAIESVIRRNAQSVNMSFSGALCDALSIFSGRGCYKTAAEFTDAFSSYKRLFQQASSTFFVAGAGNDDFDASQSLPGALSLLSNVITVGATDLDDKRAVFVFPEKSNFGSVVNISAPGIGIYAPVPNNQYDNNFGGTSASAPMVTGVAGLIKAINQNLTPAQIKQILQESANPIFAPIGSDEAGKLLGSGCTATSTPSGQVQRGCRLNAERAVCHPLVGLNCPTVLPPGPTGVWTPINNMTTKRLEHSMTLLPNGKVLIAGGQTENGLAFGATTSAELFDPATNTFTRTGTMFLPRRAHTATLLPNGKVLIAGGWDDIDPAPYIAAELYDPASGTFSFIGNMTHTRHWHTATLLQDGTVLLVGGEGDINETLASAELFNPDMNTFSSVGSMSTVRRVHATTLLQDGRVLISGGNGAGGAGFPNLLTAEIYNTLIQTFGAPIPLIAARLRHTATTLPDASVLLAGGLTFSFTPTAERFKPFVSQFEAVPGEMLTNRNSHIALSLSDGRVLIAGGKTPPGVPISDAEFYDPGQDLFQGTGNMHIPRTSFPGNAPFAVMLFDGRVLAAGGAADIDFTNGFITITDTAEIFTP